MGTIHRVHDVAKLDLERERRTGTPEVVLAEGKRDGDLVQIAEAFAEANGRILVSRLAPERLSLFDALPDHVVREYHADARILVLSRDGIERPSTGGRVLILAAGTSDIPVAEEARVVAEEVGCDVTCVYDVGVAGLDRLLREIPRIRDADVVIAVAGREGALATVVAGLSDKPVIGLPVSTGYGMGGQGEAALMSMLQSCSPLTVVNVDAGFVAGSQAAKIANMIARERRAPNHAEAELV